MTVGCNYIPGSRIQKTGNTAEFKMQALNLLFPDHVSKQQTRGAGPDH